MKAKLTLLPGLLATMLSQSALAQNSLVTYQGRVASLGTNFDGSGQFKFALITVTSVATTATAPMSGGVNGFAALLPTLPAQINRSEPETLSV